MLILDGGIGRHLEALGAPFRQPEWSALALIEKPEFVIKAHQDFIRAGADIITTNSYAIVPFHIGKKKFDTSASDLLQKAGNLAQKARSMEQEKVMIAGSVPPMFGSYIPQKFNSIKAPEMLTLFKENLLPFCDMALAETMGSIAEVQTFINIFGDCEKPLWVSVTLEDEKLNSELPKLRSGELLKNLLSEINLSKIDALLFNCSQPEVMQDAILLSKKTLNSCKLIGVYANAFQAQPADTEDANVEISKLRQDLLPIDYKKFAMAWLDVGADIIGGCCGIGPEHIKALKELKNIEP